MATVLEITAPVVTGDDLRRQHDGEEEVRLPAKTVLTPTAWDYVREAGLRVVRTPVKGDAPPPTAASRSTPAAAIPPKAEASSSTPAAASSTRPEASASTPAIREVQPAQMVCAGRCELPDQPFGCRSEEFGSGFAAPGPDGSTAPAGGLPAGEEEVEALIQQITDLVMAELERG